MIRSAILSGLVGVLAAGAAEAQSVTQSNQLSYAGRVPAGCIMATPTAPAATNASATGLTAGSADVVVTRLVDDDGVPVGASITLSLESACNQAHTLSVASQNGGLTTAGPGEEGGPFRSRLPYGLSISWAGVALPSTSDAGAQVRSVGAPARGPLTVTIDIPSGGAPLTAGSYSDQLVLELGVAG